MNIIESNSISQGETPRSVVSDLGLYCLPMSHKKDARHIWVIGWIPVAICDIRSDAGLQISCLRARFYYATNKQNTNGYCVVSCSHAYM